MYVHAHVDILHNVNTLICHVIITKHHYIYLHTIVIDQVTGVMLMCSPVDLINRCNVTWNVSSFLVYYH